MNLSRDVYEIIRILDISKYSSGKRVRSSVTEAVSIGSTKEALQVGLQAYQCIYEHKAVFVDTVKNCCDFFIPLTALGYTKLNPRTIGLLGVISSVAGIIAMVQPGAKLVPS